MNDITLRMASCVKTIQGTLTALAPPPSSVDVSTVTQSVTIHHPRALTLLMLKAAIDEAGYDILTTPTLETLSPCQPGWSNGLTGLIGIASPKQMKHLDNCEQCRTERLRGDCVDLPVEGVHVEGVRTDLASLMFPCTHSGPWNILRPKERFRTRRSFHLTCRIAQVTTVHPFPLRHLLGSPCPLGV